jgi:hypothetical protein
VAHADGRLEISVPATSSHVRWSGAMPATSTSQCASLAWPSLAAAWSGFGTRRCSRRMYTNEHVSRTQWRR